MFDPTACHVTRTAEQDYRLTWHSLQRGQAVRVYIADSPDAFYAGGDPGTPVGATPSALMPITLPVLGL